MQGNCKISAFSNNAVGVVMTFSYQNSVTCAEKSGGRSAAYYD